MTAAGKLTLEQRKSFTKDGENTSGETLTLTDSDHAIPIRMGASISSDPMTLSWENVSFSVPVGRGKKRTMKPLLNNVSGIVKPGEVVAILGSSGAGKTTLLNVLAGRIPKAGELKGTILINGEPRDPSTFKQLIGFVEQEDIMFEKLSVTETLMYSAMLRLPRDLPKKEKAHRVEEIVDELGLDKCRNTYIGGSDERGVSGGERKRVSVGIEMVTSPSILFLDEPSSGLDSFTAQAIVENISQVAKQSKKTVLMTIHQPRTDILNLFDKIILLSSGRVVFFGTVPDAIQHFASLGHPCPSMVNPSDFFLDNLTIDFRSDEAKAISVERIQKFQNTWAQVEPNLPHFMDIQQIGRKFNDNMSTNSTLKSGNSRLWPNTWIVEFATLLERNMKDMFRYPEIFGATLGQNFIMMLLIGFIFFQLDLSVAGIQNRIGVNFFVVTNVLFSTVMPTISVFPLQRQIIKHERASGSYRSSAAYMARYLSSLPLLFAGTLLFALPVYWILGLQNDVAKYLTFIAIMLTFSFVAQSMGFMIGASVPNVTLGQILGPLIIVFFLLFGGQLVNLDTLWVGFRWIRFISPIYFSYSALCQNEFTGLSFSCASGEPGCTQSGEAILKDFALNEVGIWACVGILWGMAFAYTLIGYIGFRLQSKPLMKLK